MDKAYKNKFVFVNDQAPELDADNLNKISNAIDVIDDRVIDLDTNKSNKNNPNTTGSWTHNGDVFVNGNLRHYEGESLLHNLSVNSIDRYGTPIEFKQEINYKQNGVELDNAFGQIIENKKTIEELESKPTSAMLLESTSPLEYATNNNIVGLYAEGKSEQNISKNIINPKNFVLNAPYHLADGSTTNTANVGVQTIPIGGNLEMCVAITKNTAQYYRVAWLDSNRNMIYRFAETALMKNFSTASNCAYLEVAVDEVLYNGSIGYLSIAKGSNVPYEPYTGTPTPTNPIPIKDASGVVEAHTEGNNLLALTYDVANKYYETNGTYNDSNAWNSSSEYIKASGNLIFKYPMGVNLQTLFCEYDANKNFIKRVFLNYGGGNPTKTEGETVVLNANTRYVRFSIHNTRPSYLNYGVNAEYKSNAIDITYAENLVIPTLGSKTINGITITNNNGVYTLNGTSTSAINEAVNSNFSALENGRYIFGLSDDNNVIARVVQDINGSRTEHALTPKKATFDATANATYLFQIHINSGVTLNNAIVNPKVEKCIVLRSIGNIADTFTVNEDGSGEWVQKVGVAELGKIRWYSATSGSKTIFYNEFNNYLKGAEYKVLCTHLKGFNEVYALYDGWDYGNNSICLRYDTGYDRLLVRCDGENEITFNEKMSSLNPIMYYPLATPIIHTLTKEQVDAIRKLKTYDGTTLIDAELANVTIKYAGDTKKYIDEKTVYPLIKTAKIEPYMGKLLFDKKATVMLRDEDGTEIEYNLVDFLNESYRTIRAIQQSGVATNNRIKEITSYSEDETDVGSWINPNLKLRRVVALVETPNVANLDAVIFDDVNLLNHEVKSITGTFHKDDNDYPINYYVDGSHYCRTWASREGIKMNVQGFTGCPCEFIIEYIRKADAVSAASVDESVVPMTLSLNNEAEVLPMSEVIENE